MYKYKIGLDYFIFITLAAAFLGYIFGVYVGGLGI